MLVKVVKVSKISEILWFGLVWKALNLQLLVRDQGGHRAARAAKKVILRIVVKALYLHNVKESI